MRLSEIKENLTKYLGIESLNPLQVAAEAASARSIVILAPTGSGKTVAFALPLLKAMDRAGQGLQAVVLAPSRELVIQIAEVLRQAGRQYRTVALYGGHNMDDETNALSVTPDIIVATPGRLLDHSGKSTVDLSSVGILVIDEYDKALELGFADQMRRISRRLGRLRLTIVTSATALTEVPDFIDLSRAETIDYRSDATLNAGHTHIARIESPARDKLDTLCDLLHTLPDPQKTMVFVNHRESAQRVYDQLVKRGIPAGIYHGGLDQAERETALRMLDNGSTPVLVTTDLGSRGLDLDRIGAVVHYHLPPTAENWTHRNGRTGRMGSDGLVYVITSEADNIPDYVVYDADYAPYPTEDHRIERPMRTLHFNAGKKDKLSKGDIAGFLMQQAGLTRDELGKIDLADHYALAAIKADKAAQVMRDIADRKIKNRRIRISLL